MVVKYSGLTRSHKPIVKASLLFRNVIVLDLNGVDKYWIIWFFLKRSLLLKSSKNIFNKLVDFSSLHW